MFELISVFGLSKSTVSLWVRDVPLPAGIAAALSDATRVGLAKGRAAMAVRRRLQASHAMIEASAVISSIIDKAASDDFWKFVAALLFWCEGSKRSLSQITFTNSDPRMIEIFLQALRKAYSTDERRFRVQLHLHDYHDKDAQTAYWSKVTAIPLRQFNQVFVKPHTGKRKREGYQGCASISYYDARLAKRLAAIYHYLAQNEGAW
ncbi:hypothetical protein HY633_04840 [Candidatus Uhrbacteria bacterium]|nr:hypothetical protein [Candidatus Uhrbacteria bacterium]